MCTAIAPISQMDVQLNIFNLAMYNQTIMGTVFGSASPRVQVPRLLQLYQTGQLEIDELITREYTLDEVQTGLRRPRRRDQRPGRGQFRHRRLSVA